uniref:Uncharacterized protein n=1 Tax=Plectus sambesii TaxID=2011161 RepID=A0A914UYH2_9BILA
MPTRGNTCQSRRRFRTADDGDRTRRPSLPPTDYRRGARPDLSGAFVSPPPAPIQPLSSLTLVCAASRLFALNWPVVSRVNSVQDMPFITGALITYAQRRRATDVRTGCTTPPSAATTTTTPSASTRRRGGGSGGGEIRTTAYE